MRHDGRRPDELRPLDLQPDFMESADGSVLFSIGKTRVICTASIEESVPRWMAGRGTGWVTAEYGMLPASTGQRKVWVDCDVLQADGGTRCAAICGGYVAMHRALAPLVDRGQLRELPLRSGVAAVSVGIVGETPVLDLDYAEDSTAEVDMNVVMTSGQRLVEVQ